MYAVTLVMRLHHGKNNLGAVDGNTFKIGEQLVEFGSLLDGADAGLQTLHMIDLRFAAKRTDYHRQSRYPAVGAPAVVNEIVYRNAYDFINRLLHNGKLRLRVLGIHDSVFTLVSGDKAYDHGVVGEPLEVGKRMEIFENNKPVVSITKGTAISFLATIVALTIFAVLLTYTNLSENTIKPVIITITGISILIGSSIGTRKIRKNGLITGGIIGVLYILIIYIISSAINASLALSWVSAIMIGVGITCGVLGGIIGVNTKS